MKITAFALSLVSTLVLAGFAAEDVQSFSGKTPLPADAESSRSLAPANWLAWSEWAEKLRPVTDNQGHGPDIGSDEWASALGKQLDIVGVPGSKEWRMAVEQKLVAANGKPAPDQHRELLSSHDTEARFAGLSDHRCMGLTSLCPDQCGESGKLATFKIVKYLDYKKPGEYGDPQQEQFMVLFEDNLKKAKVPVAIRDAILALKPGEMVHLKWNHDYVTEGGSKFPERPIVALNPLDNKSTK
ncbi:MAG: hypothetical protein H8M99_12035 [Gloeobacteraceae cyanobacterium ES-bin-144]|nr:hypothetical protein [Verrucomicrobiales bacterium]